jgi:hypothetical protein
MSNTMAAIVVSAVITAWKGDDYWQSHVMSLVLLFFFGLAFDVLEFLRRDSGDRR